MHVLFTQLFIIIPFNVNSMLRGYNTLNPGGWRGVLRTKVYPGTYRWNGSQKSASRYNDGPLFIAKTGINMGHVFKKLSKIGNQ